MKGVIFDFNGTLFWDSQLHIDAWIEYSAKIRKTPFTEDEMLHHMFGMTNKDILVYALGREPEPEYVEKVAQEKEAFYRNMCLKKPEEFKLAPHAIELLDYLKANKVPMAIATMSEWCNVEFYLKEFNLLKWFDEDKIIYSDGTLPGKPAPDIYLKAIKTLNLDPKDCIVFEDSITGIQAAYTAGVGEIIAVASREPVEFYKNLKGVTKIITDFDEISPKSLVCDNLSKQPS